MVHLLLLALLCFSANPARVQAQEGNASGMTHSGRAFAAPSDLHQRTRSLRGSSSRTTIIVRYLGYNCSHCVRQLLYMNSYAERLQELGVGVIATSQDDRDRWEKLVQAHHLNQEVFTYIEDPSGSIASVLGSTRTVNDTLYDLHSTIVVDSDSVRYSSYTFEPDMDVARIIGAAVEYGGRMPTAVAPEFIDRYLQRQPATTIVAGPSDGVVEPLDLDFNGSYLHPQDLWVVTTDKRGHAIVIVHEATSSKPVITRKKDSRASHFMWRTMALSMGNNGAFATAQNGEPGDGDSEYMFMGPTLWSSDTAVFASRYQDDDKYLASHLDMLHQSPYDLGIAHDSANVYWVSDAKYLGISRYDFRDPHEVGGTDHRDGVIRRYVETSITQAERGRPAHIALDKQTGYLYYVDPGKGEIHCLNTKTGRVKDTLRMPPSSSEDVEEFTSVVGAEFWTVVKGLSRPIGIEVVGKRLLVGDELTSRIYVYAIEGKIVTPMGYIQTQAVSLHGIAVGPDGRIWYVDKKAGTVCRLDHSSDNALMADRRVAVCKLRDSIAYTYTNVTSATYQPKFVTRMWKSSTSTWSDWSSPAFGPKIPAGSSERISIAVDAPDTTSWYVVELAEADAKGTLGLRAQTTIIPERTRKLVVQAERYGTFNIFESVLQTNRKGYTMLPSDVFVEAAQDLPYLKTLLWNAGTAGEISIVDDAVLRSCIDKKIDVMLIGDDPLLLRTDLPQSVQFFRALGASMRGVQIIANDNGARRYAGVLADPVTAGMSTIECQVPRLNHHRGVQYQPSVLFNVAGGSSMMRNAEDSGHVGVRFEKGTYRSIILGINASRFLDGGQRTIVLDKGLTWLEGASDADPIDTTTTSVEFDHYASSADLKISAYAHGRTIHWRADNSSPGDMTIELYASTGQKMLDIYSGGDRIPSGTVDLQHVSAGCYHIIVRTAEHLAHQSIIIR
ncbi:MAG: redoxin domain-containing protein [Ignavibacteria bacterium]|nr:redoxin domain-containing protein [Ignavibacteria bacterium]